MFLQIESMREKKRVNKSIFLVKSEKCAILLLKQSSSYWIEKWINSYVRLGHIESVEIS
jgi:hypothetical protein